MVALFPALRFPETRLAVPRYDEPPSVIVQTPVIDVLAVPEFVRTSVHASGVPTQLGPEDADTTAELVNVPRRPKKKPDTAVAAMSVIAMRTTVASTGEIAVLAPWVVKFNTGIGSGMLLVIVDSESRVVVFA